MPLVIQTGKENRPAEAKGSGQGPDKGATADTDPRKYDSAALFGGRREVTIDHGGEVYRLRLTSNNRLILIK